MSQIEPVSVNVRKILKSKLPTTKVPGFIVKYLEHISHQDEINLILSKFRDLYGTDFIKATLHHLGIKLTVYGLDELPEGHFTFAGNHPMGGIDGMCTGLAIHERYPEQSIQFLSNDLLANIPNLLPLFIPINKVGDQSQNRSLPKALDEAYHSGHQMVIFPSGTCSRRVKGKITEMGWSKSFIKKSIESKRDVVPVYFEGRNSNFFYSLSSIRKMLGIQSNIEMLYLADELFKQRNRSFRVFFGKPIPYTTFDKSKTHQQWADWMRLKSLELAKKIR
ncbi:MAG: 1-acyl-sn-glycerol-3-phosphate acyltransferase [Bacteroidota bacterium]|nr:1-acyl-sn-glycerol-3-phosphate acyltransferase [Bacteroidota bacterium]